MKPCPPMPVPVWECPFLAKGFLKKRVVSVHAVHAAQRMLFLAAVGLGFQAPDSQANQEASVLPILGTESPVFGGRPLRSLLGVGDRRGGARSEMQRLVVDFGSGEVSRQSLSHRCCEFPSIHPDYVARRYTHSYVPASRIDDPYFWGPNQVSRKPPGCRRLSIRLRSAARPAAREPAWAGREAGWG
jgi:Retinal pigment epithelial membrane protein